MKMFGIVAKHFKNKFAMKETIKGRLDNSLTEREILVKALVGLIEGKQAHATFEKAVNDIQPKFREAKLEGIPYSIWQLISHIRITQSDILEFSRNPNHHSPAWPEGYWPLEAGPSEEDDWRNCLTHIEEDRNAFIHLLQNPNQDLYTPFPYGDGQNLIREAMLIADHTAYHLGEIIVIRRLLDIW